MDPCPRSIGSVTWHRRTRPKQGKLRLDNPRRCALGGRRASQEVGALLVVAVFGCFAWPVPTVTAAGTIQRTTEYRLPTDGWKPGDGRLLAGFLGPFHATLTPSGACASMGNQADIVFLWPAGYQVRFHPTQLLSPSGKVVAYQNQWVNAGGGGYPWLAALSLHPPPIIPSYCGTAKSVVLIESPVLAGKGLPQH